MVSLKVNINRIMALLLMLAMVLTGIPCVASAEEGNTGSPLINPDATGSITVTKYVNASEGAAKGDATGTAGDTVDAGYTTLNGATFKLFKIADAAAVMAYYNGTNDTTYSLALFSYDPATGTAAYNGAEIGAADTLTGETAGDGTFKFESLSVGIYILKEVTAPDQITTPLAEDSLISIPMVNTETSSNNGNADWMYHVYVYPKNHASTGTVELTKQDQNGNGLNNVTFKLSKAAFQSTGSGLTLPKNENDDIIWTDVTKTIDNSGVDQPLDFTTADIADKSGKLILANLPAGLYGTQYKLVEVSAPNGYIVNQTPLYFQVNNDNTITWNAESGDVNGCNNTNTGVVGTPTISTDHKLTITLRNERPSLTKWVRTNGIAYDPATTDSESNWKQDEQYRLDDAIYYRLTAYIPQNVSEINYFFITDAPETGIHDSDDPKDYIVKYGTADTSCNDLLTAVTHYTLSFNDRGFTLNLTSVGKTLTAGKYIQIVYKAHMNSDAVIAGSGNGNTATLTYSRYIHGADDKYTITDEARVYTYQYRITKYKDSVAEGNKLGTNEAVDFQLLDADKNRMKVVKLSDGVYRLAITGDTLPTDPYTMTTKDGAILIQGLENDTYYLKETKTLNGYNLLSGPFEITVGVYEVTSWASDTGYTETTRTVKDYQSTAYYKDAAHTAEFADNTATANSNVINKKGFVLPQTGGMGYLLFCTVGIVLIAGGAMLIFGGRKKKIR